MTESDAFVFFGATGDLAFKQIFPALQRLITRHHFDKPIIGIARSVLTLDDFRERARASLEAHGGVDREAFARFLQLLQFVNGDYNDPAIFQKLRAALGGATRPLYYLAIPPAAFETVVQGLGATGCHEGARVVLEKPFGRDLASARLLNRALHRCFPESAIFRIDHYLGKEPVQNLLYFRFANSFMEPIWNHRSIRRVQVTMAEAFGVQGRGRFYEEVGAIRDVVQNHLLEVIALLTMEAPAKEHADAMRDAKLKAFEAMRPVAPAELVRGQFRGYRQENGVAPESNVETFAALRLHLDTDRWRGVPFFIRAGKELPVTATEIRVDFKAPAHPMFDACQDRNANYIRFRLSPSVTISIGARTKLPGEEMVGERVELLLSQTPGDEMSPYERLIGDALEGDQSLFVREDEVEAAWRVVEPALDLQSPVEEYEPRSWGPSSAERLVDGGWTNPM